MPCNGYNHPARCECGWGGQWHGNYTNGKQDWESNQIKYRDFFFDYWSEGRLSRFESYTNPNALCPVCGDRVYFYMSPYGGRVFFDELGPPWPKHPCTDRNSNSYGHSRSRDYPVPDVTRRTMNYVPPIWDKDGWDPVVILNSRHKENLSIIAIQRVDNDDIVTLGIAKKINVNQQTPIFAMERKDLGVFDISYVDIHTLDSKIEQVIGYRNAVSPSQIGEWKKALSGSAEDQNLVALSLLFGNNQDLALSKNLLNKEIDFSAVDFWLDRSKVKSLMGAYNSSLLQKKWLSLKFQGDATIRRKDFKPS